MEQILTYLKEHKKVPNYEKLFEVDKELSKAKKKFLSHFFMKDQF